LLTAWQPLIRWQTNEILFSLGHLAYSAITFGTAGRGRSSNRDLSMSSLTASGAF
jgi:hypothetical protein